MHCEICGKKMVRVSKYGVCARGTEECKQEYNRRANEANRENQERWRKVNPERVRESGRRSHEKNAEREREYRQRNRDRASRQGRERRRRSAHDELTYLIWSPGLQLHKIGITVNTNIRLVALRNGCPDIILLTTFPHGRSLEKWLHRHFSANRIKGTEWFANLEEVDVKNAVVEYEEGLT